MGYYKPAKAAQEEAAAQLATGLYRDAKDPYLRLDGTYMYCHKCYEHKPNAGECVLCRRKRQAKYAQTDKGKKNQYYKTLAMKRRKKHRAEWVRTYAKRQKKLAKEALNELANKVRCDGDNTIGDSREAARDSTSAA